MKRHAIVEVPENYIGGEYFDEENGVFVKILTGSMELMQAACKEAGVVWKIPKAGDIFMSSVGIWYTSPLDFIGQDFRPVIPAAAPEPCPNCQNVKLGHLPRGIGTSNNGWECYFCGRPESEWTHAAGPCSNCQGTKTWNRIAKTGMLKFGRWVCLDCGRPESEWTCATEPEWGGIGSGIM